jgi:N-acetyl sugar amidotransferase
MASLQLKTNYQICEQCIMDTTDPLITFDMDGVCNHCKEYQEKLDKFFRGVTDKEKKLSTIVNQIKISGKDKKYDCIIGVSGGVDSTYLAYIAVKKFGLRPLAVHFDNGWNSELSVENIHKVLETLDIDLYTHVVNWEEFRDLQISFLKASVPDAEIPTDHAISAILFKVADKYGIKYVLGGSNIATEAIMPRMWTYGVHDSRYIMDVQKKYGKKKLRSYPYYGLTRFFYYLFVKNISNIHILNYIDYDKDAAMALIQDELGWKYYGGKHFESIYTRFFQAYILPQKFNIDKRRAHLSTLILSRQLTRDEAMREMNEIIYPENLLKDDKEYVMKKLDLTVEEFDKMMNNGTKTFHDYKTHYGLRQNLKGIIAFLRNNYLWPRSI